MCKKMIYLGSFVLLVGFAANVNPCRVMVTSVAALPRR
jgi:hypothetical protein